MNMLDEKGVSEKLTKRKKAFYEQQEARGKYIENKTDKDWEELAARSYWNS
jgi:hypothetical protein